MTRLSVVIPAVCLWLGACSGSSGAPPGDVVLVILDTTRVDHLSAYGYERPTTPQLERLAAEGERYTEAWSQAPWTLPSIATILTGQPPHVHGAGLGSRGILPLRPSVTTLAERLRAAGYATGAVMNVIWCDARLSALHRGFDFYDVHATDETNRNHRSAADTVDKALEWVRTLEPGPAFLTVHFFDAHLTYDPPAPFDERFEAEGGERIAPGFGSKDELFALREGKIELSARQRESLIARYDGEIAYIDQEFGRLRAELERLGRWENALVIVVADHGEEFWEHGSFEHGHSHFRELLHVPLIVKRPGSKRGGVHPERVRQFDIAPTVLQFADLAAPAELPGQPLGLPASSAGAAYSVAEGSIWAGDMVSVRSDTGTMILKREQGASLFFLPEDAREERAVPELTPAAANLLRLLSALPPRRLDAGDENLPTPEQLDILRELGYAR
jgi:arylsulfatase A-like enzyme